MINPCLQSHRRGKLKTTWITETNIIIRSIKAVTTIHNTNTRLINTTRTSPTITINCGIIMQTTSLIQMLCHNKTRIPNTRGILLRTRTDRVAVIHIQNRIFARAKTGDVHPSNKMAITTIIKLILMSKLAATVISKNNIITIHTRMITKTTINNINKNWKISHIICHQRMIHC